MKNKYVCVSSTAGYLIVANESLSENTLVAIECAVFKVVGSACPNGTFELLVPGDDSDPLVFDRATGQGQTTEVSLAKRFLRCEVKWDGCSNLMFDAGGWLHFCNGDDLAGLGVLLGACYNFAGSMMPNFEGV